MPRKPVKLKTASDTPSFAALVEAVRHVHEQSAVAASRAVNMSLTLRNWLTGRYIVEYEQHGVDRAKYGESLLENLADALVDRGIAEVSARSLRLYRQFFLAYPGIWQSAIANSSRDLLPPPIWRSLIAKSGGHRPLREAATSRSRAARNPGVDGRTLITRLSFTHLAELIAIDDPLKQMKDLG